MLDYAPFTVISKVFYNYTDYFFNLWAPLPIHQPKVNQMSLPKFAHPPVGHLFYNLSYPTGTRIKCHHSHVGSWLLSSSFFGGKIHDRSWSYVLNAIPNQMNPMNMQFLLFPHELYAILPLNYSQFERKKNSMSNTSIFSNFNYSQFEFSWKDYSLTFPHQFP